MFAKDAGLLAFGSLRSADVTTARLPQSPRPSATISPDEDRIESLQPVFCKTGAIAFDVTPWLTGVKSYTSGEVPERVIVHGPPWMKYVLAKGNRQEYSDTREQRLGDMLVKLLRALEDAPGADTVEFNVRVSCNNDRIAEVPFTAHRFEKVNFEIYGGSNP